MVQPAGDDVLNRKSLSLMYRNYKKETEYIAGWLAWTSQQCGYLRTAMEAETQAPRKRGKAGKARKPAKQQSKNDTKVQYAINVSEFKRMAEHIASFNPKIEVPAALQKVFERVILARNKMADWFRKGHSSDQGSNMRHSYFINVLEDAAAILKPLTPEAPVVAENIKLQNRFAGLAVEETDPLSELIVEVQEKQLPDIQPLPLEQDEEGIEDDFFFAIATFLDDISKVRRYVTREWHEYRRTGEGLTRTSVLSNTAVDLVRSAEHQFDQMLSRPKRYPAAEYPVWTLPALLDLRIHGKLDGDWDKYEIDLLIKPSSKISPKCKSQSCEQQDFCMSSVYTGLTLYSWIRKNFIRKNAPITPDCFEDRLANTAPRVLETLDWVQIFDVFTQMNSFSAIDEATRGIKHILGSQEVPIWVTLAVQMFFDIKMVLEGNNALAKPFADYQASVQKANSEFLLFNSTDRPFPKDESANKVFKDYYRNMRGILRDHEDIAINNRWGDMLQTMQNHKVLGKVANNRDWFLRRHPVRCGLLKYELELQLYWRFSQIEKGGARILYIAWIYVVGSRILHPDAPRWPDMEFLLHGRQDKLFFGNCPKTIKEAVTKLDFGRGYSIANLASNRRSEHEIWNAKQIRRIEENLVVGRLFLDRLHKEPKTTTEAHEWVTRLANLMCKPESQKLMDRQENLPEGTYETSEFLKSVEAQRDPLALLGQLRLWLLADENDVHFDWAGMLSTCTSIWKTILPILGDHKMFQGEQDMLDTPGNTTARLLEMAAIGQNIGVSVPLFETIWQSIQSTIQTPSSEQNGNKTWVGDLRLNKLLNDSTPTIMLMNPGPVSFSNIYANWSNDDKRESRVGRAVWHAMQELGDKAYNGGNNEEQRDGEAGDKSVTEEAAGEELVNDTHTDGDELSDHSDSQDEGTEEIDEAASDAGSDFSVHEFTFDLNALAKNGSNHIIMGNNMKAPVVINSMQMSQLRAGPDGGFVVGGRAPSQASRIEMLPPRQSEHARAIASAEDVPELCACGLSRYGVSVRPILKMNTKAGKLQHQCMGALFEGIDVPNRDLGDAIKVRRVIVPGSQRETEEK